MNAESGPSQRPRQGKSFCAGVGALIMLLCRPEKKDTRKACPIGSITTNSVDQSAKRWGHSSILESSPPFRG